MANKKDIQTTTIRLKLETKKMLDALGNKSQTYDDILLNLIKKYKEIETKCLIKRINRDTLKKYDQRYEKNEITTK